METDLQRGDAWARWGWLFGAMWLFFFIFPLIEIWTSGRAMVWEVIPTAAIAAFVVIYIATLRTSTKQVSLGNFVLATHRGVLGFAALAALALALALMIGQQSLTALPFLVSMPVFFLPWRAVWATSLSTLGMAIVGSAWAWGVWPIAMLWGISVLVLGLSVMSRYLQENQEAAAEIKSELSLTEERERVARDVHDVLGHSLTVVTVKAELAQRLVDVDPERAKEEMAQVQDLSRQALAEIRATVGGLRVARLADEIEAAGVALAGAGIEAKLPQDAAAVDPRHRIVVAWVLREAVTNVVRHSGAHTCAVDFGDSWLRVTDDGRGLGEGREGNGVRGLRERVEQAGGSMSLGPAPHGAGTTLEVKL